MRLTKHLNEKLTDINSLIESECKPWISASKGKPVYRGVKGKPDNFKGTVRTDRKPMDTDIKIQEFIDDIMQKKYGLKPRSSGLFVTGDRAESFNYGKAYEIYPIGKFKFLWSPKIKDLYATIMDIAQDFNTTPDKVSQHTRAMSYFSDMLKTYSNKNLPQAISADREIMIVCKSYYAKSR